MSFLTGLFGQKESPKPAATRSAVTIDSDYVVLPGSDAFFNFSRSPDGKYLVAWDGERTYALIEVASQSVLFRGTGARPQDGRVSNTGAFVVIASPFSEVERGAFIAHSKRGDLLLRHSSHMAMHSCGISEDGTLAACQTLNGDDELGVLQLWALESGLELFRVVPEPGWADEFSFDVGRAVLTLRFTQGSTYRYGFDGTFLDAQSFAVKREAEANAYDLLRMAESELEQMGGLDGKAPEECTRVLSLLDRARAKGELSDHYRGQMYRMKGEVHAHLSENAAAIEAFRLALEVNPKIGVKKRLRALEDAAR